MTSQQEHDLDATGVTEEMVAEFLARHPDYFTSHEQLLLKLHLPHRSGKAVSLVERQVGLLRDENKQLQRKLNNLIQIARENDRLNARMHRLGLALMGAGSADAVFTILHDALHNEFDADAMGVRLFVAPEAAFSTQNIAFASRQDSQRLFEKFFAANKPLCGPLKADQAQFLFGDMHPDIASAALVPIVADDCLGLLAVGSRDPKRFNPSMGTLFLSHMGEMVGRSLQRSMG